MTKPIPGKDGGRKLNREKVAEIRQLRGSGEKIEYLAVVYGVSKVMIWKIVTNESWKEEP